jgi:hypothetical protein
MFVARSSGRIRFTRTAFVLAGLLPCAGLIGWAVHLRSAGHREAVRRAWEQAVGLPVGTAGIEHVRPGTIRARACTLGAPDGGVVLAADSVEVEVSAAEVRVRLDALRCDAAGARLLAGLAAEWLERGARFRRDCVVEVADFAWRSGAGDSPSAALRIECVAQGDSRAVRVVLRSSDATEDEVRVVRTVGPDLPAGVAWQVEAACANPVPFEILAAVAADAPLAGLPLGTTATATGSLSAVRGAGAWRGQAQGRLANVDLAASTGPFPGRATGQAELIVRKVAWEDGRLLDCAVACRARDGRVEQRLLDALVSVVGCRPGPAFGGDGARAERPFSEVACELVIDGRGVEVRGADHLVGAVVTNERGAVLHEPPGAVPPERIAWLLAAPAAVYVPSAGAGAWLLSILPRSGAGRERTSQTEPTVGSRDF